MTVAYALDLRLDGESAFHPIDADAFAAAAAKEDGDLTRSIGQRGQKGVRKLAQFVMNVCGQAQLAHERPQAVTTHSLVLTHHLLLNKPLKQAMRS